MIGVTIGLILSLGLPVLAGTGAHASAGATPAPVRPSVGAASPTSTSAGANPSNPGSQMASSALAATKAAGLKANVVFVPRPSASADQLAAARETGTVSPLYTASPAPMGLADYGLSNGSGGRVVGSILNTTSVVATVDMNATGVSALDLFDSSPDSYGIQLNAVLTNVTLFGTPGFSFWTQNVVEYYPATHYLVLVTNVWNFSSATAAMTPNTLYGHGVWGTNYSGLLGYYYAQYAVPTPVYYPFNLTLYLNSTTNQGRDAVYFTVLLKSAAFPREDLNSQQITYAGGPDRGLPAPYDDVIFNSLANATPPLTVGSNYTANGLAYNPIGLTNDFELIFGGPGGGSQATLFDADATLGLATWDGSAYVSVPSAYSYGGETGETVTGANVAWSNGAGGPFSTYGTMTTGPSVLTGLWNATAPEGSYPVTLDATPANAFEVLNPAAGWSANFTVNQTAIAPGAYTDTFYLIPGNYSLLTELSGYDWVTNTLDVTGPMVLTLSLTADASTGVYTPLWAFSNAEIHALATSGSGTNLSPYLMPSTQPRPLNETFGLYNDYSFMAYPGVFFVNTNATTEFVNPPSFNTTTLDYNANHLLYYPGPFLPEFNDLQYWFWNASLVGILNAQNISGWFGATTFYPAVFDTFNVIFYEGSNDLVAHDTFDTQGQGLLIFSGGEIFGSPLNIGGTSDTVWGNRFTEVPAPASPGTCSLPKPPEACALMPFDLGLGLEVAGPFNTVYNNAFLTPTTAWVLPLNLYSGIPESFTTAFNIAPVPGSNVNHAAGFPAVKLTGSITGPTGYVNGLRWEQGWQGGNYWWDYGLPVNPYNGAFNTYGVLPYDENASTLLVDVYGPSFYHASYIHPGGDYAPLVTTTLWKVTFVAVGLPGATPWGVVVRTGATVLDNFTTTLPSHPVYLEDGVAGTYTFNVSVPAGYKANPASSPNLAVNNKNGTIPIQFASATSSVTFTESGLGAKALKKDGWLVEFGGTERRLFSNTTTFYVVNGTAYPYLISGPKGWEVGTGFLPSGTISVSGVNLTETFTFVRDRTVTLKFTESGIALGLKWCVEVGGLQNCLTVGSPFQKYTFLNLTPGNYTYQILPLGGWTVTAKIGRSSVLLSGTLDVAKAITVNLTYSRA